MPRKARIDAPGALQHIIVRGIEKRNIFLDDMDRDKFIRRFASILLQTSTPCLAWVLMPNHAHLLLMTGRVPLATIMRRLLTGYALDFNRRHNRHGHLFQNRYKSFLCEVDPYLLELVRYIHLNPIRAGLLKNLEQLNTYRYSGHGVIIGKLHYQWQDRHFLLKHFGNSRKQSTNRYLKYIAEGLNQGRRDDLVGGGLVRSAGGWSELKAQRSQQKRIKGDERILGSEAFVNSVLAKAHEDFKQSMKLKSQNITSETLLSKVATHYKLKVADIKSGTKDRTVVKARSAFCYLAVRKLAVSGVEVARLLGLTQSSVSKAVARGQTIMNAADEEKFF